MRGQLPGPAVPCCSGTSWAARGSQSKAWRPAAAARDSSPAGQWLPGRPNTAHGPYLRVLSFCDTYLLENVAKAATAVGVAKAAAAADPLGCVAISTLSGDILSPNLLSTIDSGVSMVGAMNRIPIDYACIGNHEFDVGNEGLQKRIYESQATWINSNVVDPPLFQKGGDPLPDHVMLDVGPHKVALMGLCTSQLDIIRANTAKEIKPVTKTFLELWEKVHNHGAELAVPMTHQSMEEDEQLLEAISQSPARGCSPVVLGGHEHVVCERKMEHGLVLKVGMDMERVGVVDFWWTEDGTLQSRYCLVELQAMAPRTTVNEYVASRQMLVEDLMSLPIMHLAHLMSSENTRFQEQELVRVLMTKMKRVLACNLCLVNGGGVRGNTTYPAGPFKYGHLMVELAFPNPVVVVQLPGHVIEDSVMSSRSNPEEPNPGFLHSDGLARFEPFPSLRCLEINGQPFQRGHVYSVGLPVCLLQGMNGIQPLTAFGQKHYSNLTEDDGVPGKQLVLEACAKDSWRVAMGLATWEDCDHEGAGVPEATVCRRLKEVFSQMDNNGDGVLSKAELGAFLGDRLGAEGESLLAWLIRQADTNKDGFISYQELLNVIL